MSTLTGIADKVSTLPAADILLQKKRLLVLVSHKNEDLQLIGQLEQFQAVVEQAWNIQLALDLLSAIKFDAVVISATVSSAQVIAFSEGLKTLEPVAEIPVALLVKELEQDGICQLLQMFPNCYLSPLPLKPMQLMLQLSVAIRNYDLASVLRHDVRVLSNWRNVHDDDMETARNLMDSILGNSKYQVDNMRAHVRPMEMLNGDIILAANKPDGCQVFIVGDFTGHGMPAALGTVIVVDTFQTMAVKGFSVAEIARELNQKLYGMLPTGRFLSACLVEVKDKEQGVAVCNAGLPDVIFWQQGEGIVQRCASKNLPLGILKSREFSPAVETVPLESGERIYAYTDGVIEAINCSNHVFGQARLDNILNFSHATDSLFAQIITELDTFCGNAPQQDDISIIEFELHRHQSSHMTPKKSLSELSKPNMSWQFEMTLDTHALKNVNPIPILVTMLVDVQGMKEHRERLYTVLAELYNNALEHGLLQLDSSIKETADGFIEYYDLREKRLEALSSGHVYFDFSCRPREAGGVLNIGIRQSDNGFDYEKILHREETDTRAHGRGLQLVDSICEELLFSEQGKRVDVSYAWG